MNKFAFKSLLSPNFEHEGDSSLFEEFNTKIYLGKNLFYPSAGTDVDDIYYINRRRLEELSEDNPEIYIHCDLLYKRDNGYDKSLLNMLSDCNPNHYAKEIYKITDIDGKNIMIYKIESRIGNIKWLIHFRGYFNEEVLKILIKEKIKIPVVYTVCDGITHGMGGFEESIPTLFYPLISQTLGIKYIISEQKAEYTEHYIINPKTLLRWLQNINDLHHKSIAKKIITLPEELRPGALMFILKQVDESKVNNEKFRIFSRHGEIFIKKIPESFDNHFQIEK